MFVLSCSTVYTFFNLTLLCTYMQQEAVKQGHGGLFSFLKHVTGPIDRRREIRMDNRREKGAARE